MDVEPEVSEERLIRVVTNFPQGCVDAIDRLVAQGVYINRQDLIRDGTRKILTSRGAPPFGLEVKK